MGDANSRKRKSSVNDASDEVGLGEVLEGSAVEGPRKKCPKLSDDETNHDDNNHDNIKVAEPLNETAANTGQTADNTDAQNASSKLDDNDRQTSAVNEVVNSEACNVNQGTAIEEDMERGDLNEKLNSNNEVDINDGNRSRHEFINVDEEHAGVHEENKELTSNNMENVNVILKQEAAANTEHHDSKALVSNNEVDAKLDNKDMQKATINDNKCQDVPSENGSNETDDFGTNVLIQVNFKTEKIASAFKYKIIQALKTIPELLVVNRVRSMKQLSIMPNMSVNGPLFAQLLDNNDQEQVDKNSDSMNALFTVDTNPSTSQQSTVQYSTKFNLEKSKEESSMFVCFNCSGKHNMRDCPHPKDFVRINKAKAARANKGVRYHVEEDSSNQAPKPGKLSNKLKEALDLKSGDLPSYIYRMRVMGYPPGWVEEAFETSSELDMYGGDGQVISSTKKTEMKINPEKIVEYPGFNAPMEKYTRDEYRHWGVQRYSKHVNKESIIEVVKKLKDNVESCDMDIDDNDDVATDEVLAPPGCEERKSSPRLSPTLNDLEAEKMKLLAQLKESDDNPKVNPEIKLRAESGENVDDSAGGEQTDAEQDAMNQGSSAVKTSAFGTPILDRKYPFKRLPDLDKFNVDITPMINFENLPNSTGKFEQMVGVLEKVRKAMKSLTGPKS